MKIIKRSVMGTMVHMTEEELILMLEDEEEACDGQGLVTMEGSIKEGGRYHVVQEVGVFDTLSDSIQCLNFAKK